MIRLLAAIILVVSGCHDGSSGPKSYGAKSDISTKVINAADYGAVGTDSLDDTAAINSAIQAAPNGSTVRLDGGTYFVNTSGIALRSGVWLAGDGATLRVGSHAIPGNFCLALGIYCENITIRGITFDFGSATLANEYGPPVSLIGLLGCTDVVVTECKFLGIGLGSGVGPTATGSIGVITTGGARFSVTDCFFSDLANRNTYTQAALFSNAGGSPTEWTFSRNRMIGCGLLGTGSRFHIQNNNAFGVRYGGALAVGDANGEFGIISGNLCIGAVGSDANGFPVDGIQNYVPRTIIYGNTCSDNAGSGIDNGAQGCVITDNLCVSNGVVAGHGIASNYTGAAEHENASMSTYSGNVCFDRLGALGTQQYGYADSSSLLHGIVISNNRLTGNVVGEAHILGSP